MAHSRIFIPWLAWVLGALASIGAYVFFVRAEQRAVTAEFERRTEIITSVIGTSLRMHEDTLHSLRNLFHHSGGVSRAQFAGAAGDLAAKHAGIHALEWIQRVRGADRERVEAAMRAEGFTGFEFRQRVQGNVFERAADRADHYPVIYIHPLAGNEAALGFDLTSSSIFGEFLAAARANTLITSGRVRLITDGRQSDWGYLLELPVYELPVPEDSAERLDRLRGFVLGLFQIDEIVEGSLRRLSPQGIDLMVIDPLAAPENRLLHYHSSRLRDTPAAMPAEHRFPLSPYTRITTLPLSGRTWELHYRAAPELLAAQHSHQPLIILIGGLLSTALLGFFLHGNLRRTELIEREVTARTEELRQAQGELEDDIRRRQAAEEALKASETRLQAILDHNPNSIFVKDTAGRYVLVNREHARLWNRPATDFIGRSDHELFPADVAERFREMDERVLAAHTVIRHEVTVTFPGKSRPSTAIVQKFSLRSTDGHVYGICGISTDITDLKDAGAELQESRRQLSNLIRQLPGAAFRCRFDEMLTALFASEGMLALTGYSAEDFAAGRQHIAQLTVPADRPAVRGAVGAAIQGRRPFEVEYRIHHRDGQQKWVLVRGQPIYDDAGGLRFLEGLAIDVTALKQAEQEKITIERKLLAAQKLESLGVLAGGIAHDFNNILTSILGNASLARHDIAAGRPIDRSLQQIEHASRRAADLCQQMLAYAGKSKIVSDKVDLSELVRGTAALLEVTLQKNSRLNLHLADGLPPVVADPTQLRQIVMNLVINAGDAITGPDGLITVTTFAREADAALLQGALGGAELPPGIYAGLEVRDNGSGMTPETIARIFEPFFTTKFSGRGLGLSAVLGIVQSHRGALFVDSAPGKGSTFRLLLPATTGIATSSAAPFPIPAVRNVLRGTVLVIDDEEAVRAIAAQVLEVHGAGVILAASGEEGLELLRRESSRISLILLDMTMPGINGEETLRRMRMLNATQPVIVMSGYSEAETMQRCANLGVVRFIQKPFEMKTLLSSAKDFLT